MACSAYLCVVIQLLESSARHFRRGEIFGVRNHAVTQMAPNETCREEEKRLACSAIQRALPQSCFFCYSEQVLLVITFDQSESSNCLLPLICRRWQSALMLLLVLISSCALVMIPISVPLQRLVYSLSCVRGLQQGTVMVTSPEIVIVMETSTYTGHA